MVEWFLLVVVYWNMEVVLLLHPVSLTRFLAQGFLLWPSVFCLAVATFNPGAYILSSGLPIVI